MKRVHIVAAIIYNREKDKIYITKRPDHLHKGGFWEFPGGKVEQGEETEQAICRELFEEIDIKVVKLSHYAHLDYDYPDKSLTFDFYAVEEFNNEPYGKEGQQGEWVAIDQLKHYSFPEANLPVLEMVQKQRSELISK